ncbi:methyltransferase domain-containing protein [Roseateles sp. DAIF2]|uniref:class I SAM-dependent methyltransferase n=1 Tax=Roseateles sp. DAIF2 TaxID=2714952 RepID=UPI0018A2A4BA|nr:class I SAM-dependent methyltransferase [Roseateles sp. DAIF2]QPF72794.1 methyltransferase domain-containing protein [Roseateles sp. DAIF2]
MNTPSPYDDQVRLWNGLAGQAWVDTQAILDRLFQPMEDLLVAAVMAGAGPAGRVLDIGCGTGATTLAIARRQDARGGCTGLDISAPMIARARERVAQEGSAARFVCADAQDFAFEPASVDMIVSRLGLMFFGDPVTAFANLRRAARPGAALRFIAWRGAAENPFMTLAEQVAAPLLPTLPARKPGAPGQFAFAERARVQALLEAAGWTGVEIRPLDLACRLAEPELIPYLSRLGPVGLALPAADNATRARVIAALRSAYEPYVQGEEVRLNAACWWVEATAPQGAGHA